MPHNVDRSTTPPTRAHDVRHHPTTTTLDQRALGRPHPSHDVGHPPEQAPPTAPDQAPPTAPDQAPPTAPDQAPPTTPDRWAAGRPGPDEAARLAVTFGATLRRLRTGRGLSVRGLAKRAVVAHTTVLRLEAGQRRPRPVVITALANALDPHDPEPVREALTAAAGESLRPDTPRGARAHHRRVRKVVEERGLMDSLTRQVVALLSAGEGNR
ncbi:helix-turn-helix domain-containing protein [Nocardiopsis dassonvillei]|uniref:helix-turn-helix domain-containing protein n=1 Tax=Nocardiopsis dassonvillei TaxID=2014 RepID=UPI0036384510